ncbi:MAG: PaaI family thioesterase, partial [Desulfarculaceae bacterium]|nr:PaaI family thioesterase [Desulfarculaceae bacterium]
MRPTGMSWGEVRVEIELARKHLHPLDVVHGGVISSIADAAGFWAVYSQMEQGVLGMTTVELKVNHLAPAQAEGKLIGLGLGEATITTG